MKIIVLIVQGKGREAFDWITCKLFDTKEEANKFIKEVNDLESKYWTYAEIVEEGLTVEPSHGAFYRWKNRL